MIIISNLRKETKGPFVRIVCDIESDFSSVGELWFSVPHEYGDWLTDDVYDAFMLALLYPAMYYKEDEIVVNGMVSEKLHYNLLQYVQSVIIAYRPEMTPVRISVEGYANAVQLHSGVGTAFSAGIDAFTTLFDHFEVESNSHYEISSFFFFNLGSHGGGGEKARRKFLSRYNYLKQFTDSLSLPFIPLDSNLFDFYLKHWEFDAGIFCRATGALVFQRALSKYYVASDNAYVDHMDYLFDKRIVDLSSLAENYLFPMLSTESLEIIPDGAQYSRSEKTERIINYAPVREYLNVCVNSECDSYQNCSICPKCQRTLFALDVLGGLSEFRKVFDIQKWEKERFRYKCQLIVYYNKDVYAKDNVDLAKRHNYKMPSMLIAHLVVSYDALVLKLKQIAIRVLRRR